MRSDIPCRSIIAPGVDPKMEFDPKLIRHVTPSVYCAGFNAPVPNQTVIGDWRGDCPTYVETRINLSGKC
jgi:hypothetical protein